MAVGDSRTIYTTESGDVFYIKRPEMVTKGLKRKYDVKKNLQIWVRESNGNEFMPNHLRILMDLDFKRKAHPDLQERLLKAFDAVFYGDDPGVLADSHSDLTFPSPLRQLDYDLYLEQLFMAEQSVGYTHESQFEPKYLFLHGWIRCVLCGEMEIDRLVWSATRSPPPVRYTEQDNKKHKKFNPNRIDLWYLAENGE